MIEQFINFVIRPPRADYNPDLYLWEKDFTLAGRSYKRQDLELTNQRGHTLKCSHYVPATFLEDAPLPCVIYCHGNSGCRADANEAAVILLKSNITVFTLDFSGSGLSEGDYVSLGWHEKDDLKVVVSYLRSNNQISRIGLWGRSMGAVTSILYGAEDPSIAGMVLDSAFSNLFDLMIELADVYKIRVPKFTIKVALQYMRRVIQKRAKFDIMNLNCLQVAPKTFIPALLGHASGDKFIQSHHSDLIFNGYAGDKNIIKFDGDHNSSRPQFYYDSVSIFFYNVLRPPQVSKPYERKAEKYCDLGNLNLGAGMNENLLYEIIAGLRSTSSESASSSSLPHSSALAKPVTELLSEIGPVDIIDDALPGDGTLVCDFPLHSQDKENDNQNAECFSYTSSNGGSWGRCSSLGGSNEEPTADCPTSISNQNQQDALDAVATPLQSFPQVSPKSPKNGKKKKKKKQKQKAQTNPDKPKRDKFEKLEALSQRLCLCILKPINHKRHGSS
ncbi:hypothetical protein SAY86_022444 [Trapa natans]|uniref:Serine aminopeptidase S33 domain-containing protein n=1 Tax=Trapa natans TaxID=22666 RepID=A0AAN7LUC4_TRANT|nr:hypothetical protein SAY86_022444 [Trapa natans]